MPPPTLFPRERLIIFVKERPALFNHHMRSHSDKRLIKKLWSEIASKMRKPVEECRSHWAQLRNIYSTYLRRQKLGKQMNWYLSDSMEFLRHFIRPIGRYKKAGAAQLPDGGGDNCSNDADAVANQMNNENDIKAEQYLEMTTSVGGGSVGVGSGGGGGGCDDYNDDFKGFPPSSVNGSLNDDNYSDTPSYKNNYQQQQQQQNTSSASSTAAINSSGLGVEKNVHMSFFENLLPDLNSISARRQRVFKTEVMATLYKLLDEQETDEQNDVIPSAANYAQLNERSVIKIE